MASVFLSYVREDEGRARALAALLEQAGHSVWWDRHIKGGTQYAQEIEAALKAADKVVVFWSERSIASAWVRDEAAAGRDSGRLIPVTLDGTQPPLGFGQYQTINFSNWRGRGKPPAFDTLLEAVALSGNTALLAGPRRSSPSPRWRRRLLWLAPSFVIAGGIGTYAISEWAGNGARAATVTVEPASADPVAVAAARDLSVKLGSMQANVAPFRLIEGRTGADKASLVLRVGAQDAGGVARRSLSLIRGRDRSILWAGSFEQPQGRSGDLSAQLGATSALVLSCAFEALAGHAPLPPETTKLYLAGCAELEEQLDATATNVTPLFEKVVQRSPNFAPSWNNLLQSEAWRVMWEPGSEFAAPLQRHLTEVRRRRLDMPSVYMAEAAIRPSNDFLGRLGALQRGIGRYPVDAKLRSTLATMLTIVGRQEDAIEQALRAAELAPLSPAMRTNYIFILAHSGKYEQAKEELARADRLWPGATALQWTHFSLEMRYGDPRMALKVAREGASRGGQSATEAFLRARIDPSKANIDQAVNEQVKLNRQVPFFVVNLVQTLATFRRTEEALQVLLDFKTPEYAGYQAEPLFRPTMRALRQDPRFMEAMARMSLAQYWKRSGKWPDFCFEPDLPYDCRKEADRYV